MQNTNWFLDSSSFSRNISTLYHFSCYNYNKAPRRGHLVCRKREKLCPKFPRNASKRKDTSVKHLQTTRHVCKILRTFFLFLWQPVNSRKISVTRNLYFFNLSSLAIYFITFDLLIVRTKRKCSVHLIKCAASIQTSVIFIFFVSTYPARILSMRFLASYVIKQDFCGESPGASIALFINATEQTFSNSVNVLATRNNELFIRLIELF